MKRVTPPAKPAGKPLSEAAATKRLKEAARDLANASRVKDSEKRRGRVKDSGKKPAAKKPAGKRK